MISATIPTLNLNDTVGQALQLMSEFHVEHLAVVADDKFAGLIYESDLLNATDDSVTLNQLQPVFSKLAVHAETHFIEAVQMVNEYGLTVIPVIEGEHEFIGAILQSDLFKQLARR